MEIVADLHLHSKYSRAVSSQMVIPQMVKWAKIKGIDLLGTADWTHPLWLRELKESLREAGEGIFAYKSDPFGPKFMLTTEIASIYYQNGKARRIHTLFFAPDFVAVEAFNEKLRQRGVNLMSDGRPMVGLSVRLLAEAAFSISEDFLVVPSHLWTPWYGTYGDKGGFNSLKEAYGDLAKYIWAIETGHSSDPAMNWRVNELDSRAILSFSDAHSPVKMSRETTVFDISQEKWGYREIIEAIKKQKIAYTVEFYPEEGKYHYTGHRNCRIKQTPEQTKRLGEVCPVCGKQLTVGVLHRVEELATRGAKEICVREVRIGQAKGVGWQNRPPYVMLVPLIEILSECLNVGVTSQRVLNEYNMLTREFGSELAVLLKTDVGKIVQIAGEKIAEGIKRVRNRKIAIDPGYDGVFGTVKIWPSSCQKVEDKTEGEQTSLFV